MRTIFQSLAWKEWHEHKWKLASLTAILWGITALVIFNSEHRDVLEGVLGMLVPCVAPLSIFLGLGVAASERSRGTLQFLQSLPVPMWRVALHKVSFGLTTLFVPIALTIALVYAYGFILMWTGIVTTTVDSSHGFNLRTSSWLAVSMLVLGQIGVSFFVWAIATGVNRKDEVSAGAVALATMVGWGLFLWMLWKLLTSMADGQEIINRSPFNWIAMVGLSTVPGGLTVSTFMAAHNRVYLPLAFMVAAIVHVALAVRYIRRFGQISDLEIRSPKTATLGAGPLDWLGPPRRSPFTAIAWKQFRESGPLALVGLAGIVVVVAAFLFGDFEPSVSQFGEVYARVSVSMGLGIAIIIGIGVFLYDVGPGLNTFWRSRPINPNQWFWTKFFSGLAIVLAAIYGPIVLAVLPKIVQAVAYMAEKPESRERIIGSLSDSEMGFLLMFPLITIAIFAAAAAMTCLVRNAVYAAILSIGIVFLGVATVAFALGLARLVRGDGWPEYTSDLFEMTELQFAAAFFFSFLTSTLLAWLAVRNDWGQKSRY
jgi:hypothetical protein